MTEFRGRRGVVVGVDGSPEALEAARFAAAEATARGTTLTIAHAAELPLLDAPYTGEYLHAWRERGQEVLQQTLAQLPAAHRPAVRLVLELEPVTTLLGRLSVGAELLVVGHRHLGRLERIFAGDVSGPVAAHADCPVVVVPRGWTPWSSGQQPVVLALDGESPARAALEVAFASAERLGVHLVVLHAIEPTRSTRSLEEDRAVIAEITAGARQDHPDVVVREVQVAADPGRAVLAAAGVATLLVVGRGRGTARLGSWTHSIADKLLERGQCPVAVVPEDALAADVPASASSRSRGR